MKKQARPEMTGKEALAILHKAHDAVGWHLYDPDASEEERILRGQFYDAFRVLELALHGKEVNYRPLCEHCYLQLCPFDYIQVHIKGQLRTSPCCTPCLDRLKASHQLEYIEIWNEERKEWEQKEVPR